jgi:phytoene synthase
MVNYDQVCEAITKKNSSTFYKVFKILNSKARAAIYTIYAFCRECDDIVDNNDESSESKLIKLNSLEKDLKKVSKSEYKGDSVIMLNLQKKFQEYPLEFDHFKLLIDGQKQDLQKMRYKTLKELEKYSYLVASSVGLMINPILAPKNYLKLEPAAKNIGYALQLTNIIRDIGEDKIKYNRVYVPEQILKKYNLNTDNIYESNKKQNFINLFTELEKINLEYYKKSKKYLNFYPIKSKFIIKVMLYKYSNILKQIKKNNYDVFTKFRQYGDGIEEN